MVTGLIAQYPLGGVAWDYIQYPLGLKNLGHDVYYLEDSGQWPYSPREIGGATDYRYNVEYLAQVMSRFGLEDRWAYHFPGGTLPNGKGLPARWHGLSEAKRDDVLRSADLLINVSSGIGSLEPYCKVRRKAFLDSDPVFTQIRLLSGEDGFRKLVDAHDFHFTFGECLPARYAATGHTWLPTRQPITLSEWRLNWEPRPVFTTVMNWRSYKPLIHNGQTYGHKDMELAKFTRLPELVPETTLELALSAGEARNISRESLTGFGWRVVDAATVSCSLDSYREYIGSSMAEWSVAKHAHVAGRSGWFSCRSACYLAAGRPVAVEDTGFSDVLPTGEGILVFSDPDEAAAGIRNITRNYRRHSIAARRIAEQYFDAGKVLTSLVNRCLDPLEFDV